MAELSAFVTERAVDTGENKLNFILAFRSTTTSCGSDDVDDMHTMALKWGNEIRRTTEN
jgi:hypothetical protein